jgi:hypothetical protein
MSGLVIYVFVWLPLLDRNGYLPAWSGVWTDKCPSICILSPVMIALPSEVSMPTSAGDDGYV